AESNRLDQDRVRQAHQDRGPKPLLTLAQARERKTSIDWQTTEIPTPSFVGIRVLDGFPLDGIVPFIDWSPFFHTWELRGRYPQILDDPKAKALFDLVQQVLSVTEQLLGLGIIQNLRIPSAQLPRVEERGPINKGHDPIEGEPI